MKASILLLTILGMVTINFVTGGPIEDPKHEASSENVIKNADVSDVDVLSRRKRSSCCWKVRVSYSETHHVQKEQSEIFQYYTHETGSVNGHPHYTSVDGKNAIWYNTKNKGWMIGDTADRGGNICNAHTGTNDVDCPEEVAFTWKYWNLDPDMWLNADKGLTVYCKS